MSLFWLPLCILSAAAGALVGLRKGFEQAFYVLCIAALLILISSMIAPEKPAIPIPLVFVLWVPVLVGAWRLRNTASQSDALLAIGIVCGLFVVGMYLAVGDVVAWWTEWMATIADEPRDSAHEISGQDDQVRLANGFFAMGLGFGAMFTLLFARWLQSIVYNPGGFASEFIAIKLSRTVLIGILVGLLTSGAYDNQMMADLFMVSMMIYFFQGLAVLHGVVIRRRLNRNWLVVPYLGFVFLPQVLIPGIALLGVADAFIGFRSRR